MLVLELHAHSLRFLLLKNNLLYTSDTQRLKKTQENCMSLKLNYYFVVAVVDA